MLDPDKFNDKKIIIAEILFQLCKLEFYHIFKNH